MKEQKKPKIQDGPVEVKVTRKKHVPKELVVHTGEEGANIAEGVFSKVEDPNIDGLMLDMDHFPKEKIKYTKDEYAQVWYDTKPPSFQGNYLFGSYHRSKIYEFLNKVDITLQEFQDFMALPTKRLDSEDFPTYKLRQKFVQHLFKMRKEVKDIILYKKMLEINKQMEDEKKANEESNLKLDSPSSIDTTKGTDIQTINNKVEII